MLSESRTVEFKREYVDDVKKTVVAFANTDGGKIYFGVEDDGSVCGVPDPDGVSLRFTNAVRDAIRPDVTSFVACAAETVGGKTVVAADVQRGTARPYYLAGRGLRPEGVFVRQGSSTVPASETAILDMIKDTSGGSWEEARSLDQHLTFTKTAAYFRSHGLSFGEAQKRTLGLLGADGTFTNLALLLSEQCPHTIRAAVFEGAVKTVFRDRRELCGSLLEQLEAAYMYVDGFNRTRAEVHGLERVDTRDYPPEAVREMLLNLVVHRDYSFGGSALVSVFDDRLEAVSLGGLVKGATLADVMLGCSVLRNQKLANIFYRLKLIEAYGTGIMKIKNCYAEYGLEPKFEVSDHAFKVTLPNINYKAAAAPSVTETRTSAPLASREGAVLELLSRGGLTTRRDVQEKLGVSQATAILLLREMTARGLLVRHGGGKQVKYGPAGRPGN